MQRTFWFIYFLFVSHAVLSQSVKEEFKKINSAYLNSDNLSFNIVYKTFANHYSIRPVEEIQGSYKKSGKNYFWESASQYTVQNQNYFISVDKEGKTILVGDPEKATFSFAPIPVDSLLLLCSKASVSATSNNEKRISLEFHIPIDFISKIDIKVNQEYLISSIVIYYSSMTEFEDDDVVSDSPRVEIYYKNIRISDFIDPEIFSESAYFFAKDRKLLVTQSYSEFQLIDQRFKR